jgi:hypothetical protein
MDKTMRTTTTDRAVTENGDERTIAESTMTSPADKERSHEITPTTEIQRPTAGRVVLYSPSKQAEGVRAVAQPGVEDPALQVFPATVLRHEGGGRVRLVVAGFTGIFTAAWGEVQPGEPAVGHWCYPPMTRETIEVADKFRERA